MLEQAIKALASADLDRARHRNAVGFNKSDSWFGHTLASIPESDWTQEQRIIAYKMARKYSRQLQDVFGIDFAQIPVPKQSCENNDEETVKQRARRDLYHQSKIRQVSLEEENGGGFKLSFPYDEVMISDLKSSVPGRRWIPEEKRWHIPISSAKSLAEWAKRHGINASCLENRSFEERRVEIENDLVYIYFLYDPELVEAVKTLPTTKWDRDNKRWVAKLETVAPTLKDWCKQYGFTTNDKRKLTSVAKKLEQRREASEALDANLSIANLGGDLKPFQRAGVKYALNAKRVIIGDEMGLGKTPQSLATIEKAKAFPAVIVVPANIRAKWLAEIEHWLPKRTFSIAINNQASFKYRRKDGSQGSVETNNYDVNIVVINYDILESHINQLLKLNPKSVVFDESAHYLKNPKAIRTKSAEKLAQNREYVILTTGTAILNRPNELITQLRLINRLDDFGGWKKFVTRYCDGHETYITVRGGYKRKIWDISGSSNLEELNRLMRERFYIRRNKADVLQELDEVIPDTFEVTPTNKEQYHKLFEEFRQKMSQTKNWRSEASSMVLSYMTRLRYLAGVGKIEPAIEWINEFLETTNDKIVVFAWHKDVQNALYQALPNAARIVGGDTKGVNNADEVSRFQTDPSCRIIVASLMAGSFGNDLTAATHVLFVELPWRPGDIDQAIARAYGRLDNPHGVNAYYMLAESTLDTYVAKLIDTKRSVVDLTIAGKEGISGEKILALLVDKLFEDQQE